MVSLRESGMTFKEVADWLNERGYKPPRGERYYKELVQMTYRSVMERWKRERSEGEVITLNEWIERKRV